MVGNLINFYFRIDKVIYIYKFLIAVIFLDRLDFILINSFFKKKIKIIDKPGAGKATSGGSEMGKSVIV